MMRKEYIILTLLLICCCMWSFCTQKDNEDFAELSGPYLGQKPPGMTPEIFAPDIISAGYHESSISFSPDGKEVYYDLMHLTHEYSAIVFSRLVDGIWSEPEVVSFSGTYMDSDAFLSHDGNKLYFSSNRPTSPGEEAGDFNIWFVERTGSEWSKPQNIGIPINSDTLDVNPCLTRDGTIYFASMREGGRGSYDIFRSRYVNGQYLEPKNLGDSINSEDFESSPYVDLDGNFMIFNYFAGRNSSRKSGLNISFKKEDGTWTAAVNMGTAINEDMPSIFAHVSYDGKYLFYTSNKVTYLPYLGKPKYYNEVIQMFNSPQNGTYDIYWVDARIIETLKPDNFK